LISVWHGDWLAVVLLLILVCSLVSDTVAHRRPSFFAAAVAAVAVLVGPMPLTRELNIKRQVPSSDERRRPGFRLGSVATKEGRLTFRLATNHSAFGLGENVAPKRLTVELRQTWPPVGGASDVQDVQVGYPDDHRRIEEQQQVEYVDDGFRAVDVALVDGRARIEERPPRVPVTRFPRSALDVIVEPGPIRPSPFGALIWLTALGLTGNLAARVVQTRRQRAT
jgi:hypothetical protein